MSCMLRQYAIASVLIDAKSHDKVTPTQRSRWRDALVAARWGSEGPLCARGILARCARARALPDERSGRRRGAWLGLRGHPCPMRRGARELRPRRALMDAPRGPSGSSKSTELRRLLQAYGKDFSASAGSGLRQLHGVPALCWRAQPEAAHSGDLVMDAHRFHLGDYVGSIL
jgi:hypothetical protein